MSAIASFRALPEPVPGTAKPGLHKLAQHLLSSSSQRHEQPAPQHPAQGLAVQAAAGGADSSGLPEGAVLWSQLWAARTATTA